MNQDNRLELLIPAEEIDGGAMSQILNFLKYPFVRKLAVMPDVHQGYHLPIGGVVLLDKGIISPSAVGYDIGCGMCCIITDIPAQEIKPHSEKIFREITARIPSGFEAHRHAGEYEKFRSASSDKELEKQVNEKLFHQLGTLGSGNHFIEIGEDMNRMLSLTLHSGSRNPGHSVGGYYMRLSKTEDKSLPEGFLDLTRDTGRAYLADMRFMLEYALANRLAMLETVKKILGIGRKNVKLFINENHNHAEIRGDGVLHRKGATPAEKGQAGVIPANMRDGVFITEGLGNERFLSSASHGAGRVLGRKEASKRLSLDRFVSDMKGITAFTDKARLEEAPQAYKNINRVMELQEGVVIRTLNRAKPFINVKG
ncbi:MAG: RtcB family protein [Deferribacterales bacterium]